MKKTNRQILEFPRQNYALKALQEIVEVTQKNEFTVTDLTDEMVVYYPGIKKKDIGILLSQYFIPNNLIEVAGKRQYGKELKRCLTRTGIEADWKTFDIPPKKRPQVKTVTKGVKSQTPQEPLQKKLTEQQERFDWVEAFLEYIEHLKTKAITLTNAYNDQKEKHNKILELSLSDQQRKHNEEIKEWRETVKAKNETIAKLNEKVTHLNGMIRRQRGGNLLQDIASFKESQKKL